MTLALYVLEIYILVISLFFYVVKLFHALSSMTLGVHLFSLDELVLAKYLEQYLFFFTRKYILSF